MADRKLSEAKRDKLHDIVEVAGESNRRWDREHEVAKFLAQAEIHSTRRRIFTILAVLTFIVMSWQAYWVGADYDMTVWVVIGREVPWVCRFPFAGLVFALLPTILLSLSLTNSFMCLRRRYVLSSALLMGTCSGFICWLGESDYVTYWDHLVATGQFPLGGTSFAFLRATHPVSWFSLVTPIILTTAFVIFGAWRRAVRDAEVEAVGEDE